MGDLILSAREVSPKDTQHDILICHWYTLETVTSNLGYSLIRACLAACDRPLLNKNRINKLVQGLRN